MINPQDIGKLLNLLSNAKETGFDSKLLVRKLHSVRWLEEKQERLKRNCETLPTQVKECNKVLPLAQKIVAMNIDIGELLALDTAVNEIARRFNLPLSVAALRLFSEIRDYNRIGGIKKELQKLYLPKIAITEACSRQSQALFELVKMQNQI